MGPALVPIAVAIASSAASAVISNAMAPDAPEMTTPESLEKGPAENQTVAPGDKAKEEALLADKEKRKKQGYLESFGSLGSMSNSQALI